MFNFVQGLSFMAKWSCIVPKSMLNGVIDGKIIMLTAKNH